MARPYGKTVLSNSGLAFELRQGDRVLREGEDADYVRQGLSVLLSQEVADAAKELTLAVTPTIRWRSARARAGPCPPTARSTWICARGAV